MRNRISKSIVSVILTVALLLMTVLTGVVASADGGMVSVGEVSIGATSVTVHCGATGAKEWFHIFPKGYTSSAQNLGSYKYCKANADVVYNLTNPITAGEYVVVMYLNDGYTVGDTYEFMVGSKEDLPLIDKESYYSGETINVLWDNVPAEYGWVGVYAKGNTTYSNYGDYIERGRSTSFPSGDSSRYKSLSWPLAAGEYSAVFFVGSGYTVGKTVDFTVKEAVSVSLTSDTVEIGKINPLTLSISGGLTAGKYYFVRLYHAKSADGVNGLGSKNVDFSKPLIGQGFGITAAADGSGSATEYNHGYQITEPGNYAYVIMDNWNSVATAFFTAVEPETPAQYIDADEFYVGATNINLNWDEIPSNAGWAAIYREADKDDKYNYADYIVRGDNDSFPSGITSRYKSGSWPIEEGTYYIKYYVGTGYDIAGISTVTVKQGLHADVTTVQATADTPITITVDTGLEPGKYYYVRLYKAYGGAEATAFGSTGLDWSGAYGAGFGVTGDENGAATVTEDLHVKAITEPGNYAYVIMDENWATLGHINFTVTAAPKLAGDVNGDKVVDVRDLVHLKKVLAEEVDFTLLADVNNDEDVDATDIIEWKSILLNQ